MSLRWTGKTIGMGLAVLLSLGTACGGESSEDASPPPAEVPSSAAATTAPRPAASPAPTFATIPPPEGVESFAVSPSHSNDPVVYEQKPPVGGPHAPSWETCVFRDRPVANESAVHSLEHGAIWVTYRPDLPPDQIQVLARLAASRHDMLVSRWDDDLPAPVVVSSWGRQLKLQSATDPRLVQFAQAFTGQAPEPSAPC
jgi:hypothetical protein